MSRGVIIGSNEELFFNDRLNKDRKLTVSIEVYAGEIELTELTRTQAIELVDHLSTIFNLEDDSENPADVNEDTAA